MTATVDRSHQTPHMTLGPLHAVLLAGTIPLFLGALLSDIAYFQTYQIQWVNFSSWLVAGGLVFTGLALLCGISGLFRAEGHSGRSKLYVVLLLLTWVLGFINSLVHARDAWATMPSGLILSVIVALLACIATAVRFSARRTGGAL